MDVLSGLFGMVAVVLVVSGVAKLWSPTGFVDLLRALGVTVPRAVGQVVGALEVTVGLVAVVVGGRAVAAAVAVLYGVFAVAVVLARRAGAPSCGCFGAVSAPPSAVHAVVNVASALVAAAAAALGAPSLLDVLRAQPLVGLPFLTFVLLGAALVVVVDTTGAQVVQGIGDVAALGPQFRENAVAAARTTHTHAEARPDRGDRPSGRDSARAARAALAEGRR